MKRPVIDSDFYLDSQVETLFFPGGEPHAKLPLDLLTGITTSPLLYLKARTWNDVGLGACVWDTLVRYHREYSTPHPALFMPYSPAARQDKTDGTAPITKGIIAAMFAANKNIHVFDIHSDLYSWNWRPHNWMPADLNLPMRPDVDFVIAPDAGARNRALDFMQAYCKNAKLVEASKERDQSTGRLSNYKVDFTSIGVPPVPVKCLVVDDICDGGATFNMLADAVKAVNPFAELELFVSHGIFSKGLTALRSRYTHFYTTDSFYGPKTYQKQDDVTVYSLKPLVEMIANDY